MKIPKNMYIDLENAIKLELSKFCKSDILNCRKTIGFKNCQFTAFCWYIFNRSNINPNVLYKAGLNDLHIETALKRILKKYK